IQLDMQSLYAASFTQLFMSVSSIQTNEGYFLWGSDTAGSPGTLLRTKVSGGDDNFSVPDFGTAASDYRYFSVSATKIKTGSSSSDILILNGVSNTNPQPDIPVPEPATLALLGLGLAGAALARRRNRGQPRAT
ncbi:MAG: PEP-CTERM sorting domain-containing protein, partial [Pseudomonadota bacterium]|nr:PEP-CTERM sorting domain-containing protein [Pseudomonadota bacterium]